MIKLIFIIIYSIFICRIIYTKYFRINNKILIIYIYLKYLIETLILL